VRVRYFTVAEAEELLPRLSETFRHIELNKKRIDVHMDQLRILDALWGPKVEEEENPDHQEYLSHKRALAATVEIIERRVDEEVFSLGVRLPQGGLEFGLVDFPTRFEGRTVLLCWRYGEPEILAWHEEDAGFQGRRPLTPEEREIMGSEPEAG
jgi:hypothetical protein